MLLVIYMLLVDGTPVHFAMEEPTYAKCIEDAVVIERERPQVKAACLTPDEYEHLKQLLNNEMEA